MMTLKIKWFQEHYFFKTKFCIWSWFKTQTTEGCSVFLSITLYLHPVFALGFLLQIRTIGWLTNILSSRLSNWFVFCADWVIGVLPILYHFFIVVFSIYHRRHLCFVQIFVGTCRLGSPYLINWWVLQQLLLGDFWKMLFGGWLPKW